MLRTGERDSGILITQVGTGGRMVADVLKGLADFPCNSPIDRVKSRSPNIADQFKVFHLDTIQTRIEGMELEPDIVVQEKLTPVIGSFSTRWERSGHFLIRVSGRVPDLYTAFEDSRVQEALLNYPLMSGLKAFLFSAL